MYWARVLALTIISCALTTTFHAKEVSTAAASKVSLPILFEPNQGQTDAKAKFLVRSRGYTFFITDDGAVADLGAGAQGVAVWMRWQGSAVAPVGEGRQASHTNYLIGDPKQWRVSVANFSQVRAAQVFPGVDVMYHARQGKLEYDLVLRPQADLKAVRFKVEGAKISLRPDGTLVMKTAVGDLVQRLPVIYQMKGQSRREIKGHYVLQQDNTVGFEVPGYDRSAELVIDPVMEYATYLGGTDFDTVTKVAVDSNGYAYVTGGTNSTDFPTTTGAYRRTCVGSFGLCSDAVVVKLNKSGTGLIYSTLLGGSASDQGNAIAVDGSGNAYVTGFTNSSDFPGTLIGSSTGFSYAFVTKLNATGTGLLYSTRMGGSQSNQGVAIAVDSSGNAYVTGNTAADDFPVTAGAYQTTCGCAGNSGDYDSFVAKVNAAGTGLVYATYLGGSFSDFTHSIAVDGSGRAYVAGETGSNNFPTTAGAYQTTDPNPAYAVFAVRLNASGTAAEYSTYLGGSVGEGGGGIAFDSAGNAYVTGATVSPDFPTTAGAIQRTNHGHADAFVTKLNSTGSGIIYSTLLGGSGDDGGWAVQVNGEGNAYVLGSTTSPNFPQNVYGFQRVYRPGGCGDSGTSPCADAFVAELNPTGTQFAFSSYLGGTGMEWIDGGSEQGGIALGPGGSVFVAGGTESLDFPVTNTAYQRTSHHQDGFVAKIVPLCGLNTSNPSVTICSPGSSTVHSPVTVIAGTFDSRPVKLMQIYVDGSKKYEARLSSVEAKISMAAGDRRLTVQGIDTNNVVFKKTIAVHVSP